MKVDVVNYEDIMQRLDRDALTKDAVGAMKASWVSSLFASVVGTVPRVTGAYAQSFALDASDFSISSSSDALRPIEGGHMAPDGTLVPGAHAIVRVLNTAVKQATEPLRVAIAAIEAKWGRGS
jgi:hypothetical protein